MPSFDIFVMEKSGATFFYAGGGALRRGDKTWIVAPGESSWLIRTYHYSFVLSVSLDKRK